MPSFDSLSFAAPRRSALLAALAVAGVAAFAIAPAAQAQTPPPYGTGVFVSGSIAGAGTVGYATGPGVTIYNGGGLSIDAQPYFTVTSPLAMPLGLTTATVSAMSTSPNGVGVGEVHSTADLAEGVLRASASGTSNAGYNPVGPASARSLTTSFMQDALNFSVAGGGTADITVTVHLDGSFALYDPAYAFVSQSMGLSIGGASFSEIGGANNTSSYHGTSGASGYVPPSGWQSYSFSNETPEGFDFVGVLQVSDLEHTGFHLGLDLDCWGATCDFTHTGRIGLSLPDGVSFTSDSGVFLSGTNTVTPVPEPETWALMLAGLGIVGNFARRRQRG